MEAVNADALSASVLEATLIPQGIERVLFQTRNSERWARGEKEFSKKFVGLTEDEAHWLVSRGIKLVGTDYLSVAVFGELVSTHQVLLEAGVILVESLNLSGIAAGMYQLVCLPLKLEDVEGAPARVILIDRDNQFDYKLENDPRFLARVAAARKSLREGKGVQIKDLAGEAPAA